MLLTNGERVLLQTAIVPVYCTNGSIISARILLDSASQRTFMTERLAKQLNLPSQRKETLSILTFGSHGPQSIDTYVVNFTIITKKGSSMSLCANVLKQITSPIQRGPLQKVDLEFLQSITSERLADVVPISAETAIVDILVGSDYFWNIVDVERIVLPSGLLLLSSKLGYLLTGKFMNPKVNTKPGDNQLSTSLVMTQMNQSVTELNLFSVVDSSINKSPNLKDLWIMIQYIWTITIKLLNSLIIRFIMMRDDIKLLGLGNLFLPENYDVAYGRIKSLSRRFQADRNLLQQYDDILQSQLK